MSYLIEFVGGGPMDGNREVFRRLLKDGHELVQDRHSYTFNLSKRRFEYRGRWRHIEIDDALLTYRTFDEALRQLMQLQFVGAITKDESLGYEARIKRELFNHATH